MSDSLEVQAERFAQELTHLINGTVSNDVLFSVVPIDELGTVFIQPAGSSTFKPTLIPITSDLKSGEDPWLWLKVQFKFALKGDSKYLTVLTSIFSLVVDSKTGYPLIRLEYEREGGFEPTDLTTGRHKRNAAHVQIHGESELFGYIQGKRGAFPLRQLSDVHFPVGGKRYRPSLEDFLEFLHSEGFISAMQPGARDLINSNRSKWHERQLKAAVLNAPQTAIQQLVDMGYVVEPKD